MIVSIPQAICGCFNNGQIVVAQWVQYKVYAPTNSAVTISAVREDKLIQGNIEYRCELNQQFKAGILPFVFDGMNMSRRITDYPGKLLAGHPLCFSGLFDRLTNRHKVKFKPFLLICHNNAHV